MWENKERFWVTFKKIDAESALRKEKVYWCYYPTNRNVKNLLKNTFLAIKIIFKERPDLIISTGAAPAIPFFYIGKIFGAKLIYIEVYDRLDLPTLSGKFIYPICDEFLIQWEEQRKYYKDSKTIRRFILIFITVGTHEQQFNRLVKEVDKLKESGVIKEDVLFNLDIQIIFLKIVNGKNDKL